MAQDQTDLHTRTTTTADGNAVITRRVHAPTEAVWSVLADNSSITSIAEDVTGGPGRLIPRPARQLLPTPRNTEALRRLALIAEGHTRTDLTVLHSSHQTETRRAHG